MDTTTNKLGTFCWADLNTTDTTAAKKFYGTLFGWQWSDSTMPGGAYTTASVEGKQACGLAPLNPDLRKQGIPSHWDNYVLVEDVDELTNKVTSIGGKVISPVQNVADAGRWSAIQDPTGGRVCLWQSEKHIGAGIWGKTNSVCWVELMTTNVDVATKFYTQLLGWTAKTQDMGGMNYTLFSIDNKSFAGMMEITKKMGPIPPHWCTYFDVDSCDRFVERAKANGAKVLAGPQDVSTVGRFATLQDPQGAVFSVIKPEPTTK